RKTRRTRSCEEFLLPAGPELSRDFLQLARKIWTYGRWSLAPHSRDPLEPASTPMPPANDITWLTGGGELLDRIEPLWRELRAHHAHVSSTWRENLLTFTFDHRKADLLKKSPKGLLVLLAIDNDKPVGYC